MPDLQKQVAEMPCQGVDHAIGYPELCPDCQGTGLRWPELSKECPRHGSGPSGYWKCGDPKWDQNCNHRHNRGCTGTGRVPNVTLEKVLDEAYKIGGVMLSRNGDAKWCCSILGIDVFTMELTALDAACAALLVSGGTDES